MRIGFVGLGRMGAPIATNIAKSGFPLTVWNRSSDRLHAFADEVDCDVASDMADLARRSDIVVTMVADGDALNTIFFSNYAVTEALAGKVVLDMSTTGPSFAIDFAARLAAQSVRFVESPVSGSTAAARQASLTLLVGAAPADLEYVRPVLQSVGADLRHLGAPGAGSLVKLAINVLIYGMNQTLAEALILAERGGLDRAVAYDAFLASAAATPAMHYRRNLFLHPGEGEVSFALALADKDLRLTIDLAETLGSPMPQAELNRRVVQDAIGAGLAQEDLAIVADHLRRRATQLQTTKN